MSALLDGVLDAERLAEIARNDVDHGTGPLRVFRVCIKAGAKVVSSFEAMGRHGVTVAEQHECLCDPGQYVLVTAIRSGA